MIVHASISENNNAGWDGKAKAGDQTGKEVCTRSFYKKPWRIMLRFKDSEIALKASQIAVKLANSGLVGYDQSERNTLYKALKKYNWDADAYIASGTKTETDCSAFIYACYACIIPGLRSDDNAPVTATMRDIYPKYGFTVYIADKWIDSDAYLIPGDILVKEGSHTVMNISIGSKVNGVDNTPTQVKEVISFMRDLIKGDKGYGEIATLQRLLKSMGYYTGEIDRSFGSKTEEAVKAFQADKGVQVNYPGTVGPKTWTVLLTKC